MRDLPNLIFGNWEKEIVKESAGTKENPKVINDMEIFEVENNENGLLYTVKEITKGITIQEEDQNDIITD